MQKIAIFVAASIYNRKGLFVAVHQRIRYLKKVADYDIDAYIISVYKPFYIRLLVGEESIKRPESVVIDGINYRIIWIRNTLLDFLCVHKLKTNSIFDKLQFKKYISLFQKYDLIEGHSCGGFIKTIHEKYGIPYLMTWHGTDTHTTPYLSKTFMNSTRAIMEGASHNFFVSKALMEISDSITKRATKSVLYNGRDERFYKYSIQKREELRVKFGVQGKKVVAYVGNLLEVKNADSLPSIFSQIFKQCSNTIFWVIGNGPLKPSIEKSSKNLPIYFWGDVVYDDMPDLMNAIDLIVVPSRQEGLSLVAIEALSCGANVVSSKIGGIPEVVGDDYSVKMDDDFIENFSEKCINTLFHPQNQNLLEVFDWDYTAKLENDVIKSILEN